MSQIWKHVVSGGLVEVLENGMLRAEAGLVKGEDDR